MKIAGLISKGYPFAAGGRAALHGGAQLSHLELLGRLAAEHGHECVLLTEFPARKRARVGGVEIVSFRDREELWQTAEAMAPDAILGALALSCDAVRIAEHMGVPAILFPHSYEAAPLAPALRERFGLTGTEAALTAQEWKYAWDRAARVYACSSYLRDYLESKGRPCSHFVYPEFAPERIRLRGFKPSRDGLITGICGFSYKGADVFLHLARAFPHERFQLFGTVEPRLKPALEEQKNIALRPHAGLKEILLDAKLILVPSQWPEPFGRMAVEAMANGVPVLVSATGGLIEAAPDETLQVKQFRSTKAWEQRLAGLLRSPARLARNGDLGRTLAQRFLSGASTHKIDRELRKLAARRRAPARAQTIALCGNHSSKTAYSLVNTELAKSRQVVTLERTDEFRPERLNVIVHHDYAQDFKSIEFPGEGKVIAIRTWDFGQFPASWVAKINEEVDQLWVHCRWVADNAVQSGVPASKVRVIPLGVDEKVFHPEGRKYRIPTRKKFRFLFVGRTIIRKGIDKLLAAYGSAFTRNDDVCLVIKDNSRDVFYKGIDYRKQILEFAADTSKPEVLYLDRYFSTPALASLYRACDVGVFPYRAEGFCLPILEAMACGVPAIVPRFGACLDFCSDEAALFVHARRISLPVSQVFAINTLGFTEHVTEVDFCEVPVEALAERMREAYAGPREELARKGREAARTALGSFRWADTVARMDACIQEVALRGVPVRFENRRRLSQRHLSLFNAAKDLFLNRENS